MVNELVDWNYSINNEAREYASTLALCNARPQYTENISNAFSSASVNTPSNLFTICTTPITLLNQNSIL